MRKVTAITIFKTAEGTRVSIVYSEINQDGVITKDNARIDRILVDDEAVKNADELIGYVQIIVDGLEG